MEWLEVFYWTLAVLACVASFVAIGLTFYLGRNKIKEIDRLVYGYEIPGDSIFFQGQRMMNYGGAFTWRWSAKRAHLLHIRNHFDKKFELPFIITFCLFLTTGLLTIVLFVLDEWVLHVTA